MPRSEVANEAIRAQRRADILSAAAPVFARKGYAGTKIADLATAAGMSQGLLYRYFSSKDEVFTSIVAVTVQHSVALAEQALARAGTPWEQLQWFVTTFLPLQYDHPEYALVISHALTNEAVPPAVREHALHHLNTFIAIIRDLIRAGQAMGDIIARDAEQLAIHLLATLHGLAAGAAFYQRRDRHFPTPDILLLAFRPTI